MGAAAWPALHLLRALLGRCSAVEFKSRSFCVSVPGHIALESNANLFGFTHAGAVAVLCTLRLLRALGDSVARASVHCITFGMPAIGNAALANHVSLLGWNRCFTSFVLPGGLAHHCLMSSRC